MAKRPGKKHRGVYERVPGSGIWHIRFKHRGRVVRRCIGPYGLAVEEYSKARAKVAEGTYRHQARRRNPTLKEYLAEHLDRNRHRLRSIATVERQAKTLGAFFGRRTLREIETRDVERFIGKRLDAVSEASVNRELALMKTAYNAAIRDGLVFDNPVRAVKLFREQPRVRFLTEEEEAKLRKAIGPDAWPMVEFALHTGMRQGEQFRLRWDDVDLANGIATIPLSKSGRTRHVYLNETALGVLRTAPSRLKSPYVFPSATGATAADPKNFLGRHFLPAVKDAGIVGFRWHDLRHTFASRLTMRGAGLRDVQELMGHQTIAMTVRYAHLAPGHLRGAVQLLSVIRGDTPSDTQPESTQAPSANLA